MNRCRRSGTDPLRFTLHSVRETMDKVGPRLDEIEFHVRELEFIPADLLSKIRNAKIPIRVTSYMPPGIILEVNLTGLRQMTIASPLEQVSEYFKVYDLRTSE